MRIDPYTGEEFTPKRHNQKFASRANQVAYNNTKARLVRTSIAKVNNALNNNRKVLERILGEKESVTVSSDFLLGAGFNFQYFSQSVRYQSQACQMVYNYLLIRTAEGKFTIKQV